MQIMKCRYNKNLNSRVKHFFILHVKPQRSAFCLYWNYFIHILILIYIKKRKTPCILKYLKYIAHQKVFYSKYEKFTFNG